MSREYQTINAVVNETAEIEYQTIGGIVNETVSGAATVYRRRVILGGADMQKIGIWGAIASTIIAFIYSIFSGQVVVVPTPTPTITERVSGKQLYERSGELLGGEDDISTGKKRARVQIRQ